jgi:hypothetical protein
VLRNFIASLPQTIDCPRSQFAATFQHAKHDNLVASATLVGTLARVPVAFLPTYKRFTGLDDAA